MLMRLVKSLIKPQPFLSFGFLLLILYVVLRTALVDMTHDEAWSFHNIKNFWYAEFLCTGNSHWFTSIAMQISIWLGCENVFCLRWFSLLSFIITCVFSLWWLRSFISPSIKLVGFCLLFLNPYLLDYFGLARGYAGGIMFQCLSLFFFVKGLKNNNRQFLFAALACSAFSAVSNYSFVYYFFAFGILYFYKVHFEKKEFLKKRSFYFDLFFCLFVAFVIIRAFIFIICCSNDVVGAGEPSFFSMFHVFSDGLLYYKLILSKLVKYILSGMFFIIVAIACLYGIIKRKDHASELYYSVSIVLSLMLFTMVINYFCFSVVYPFYRSAQLLFFPSFMAITYFLNYNLSFKVIKPIIYIISAALILNFCLSINFKYTFDYKEQADGKDCFNRVKNLNPGRVGISPEIYGLFANYYQMTDNMKYDFIGTRIETCRPVGFSKEENELARFDYLVLFPPYDLSYFKNNKVGFDAVYLSPTTKTLILKVKKP